MPIVHFATDSALLSALETRGARAAYACAARGVRRDDVVAVLLRNEPAFIEALTCIRCLNAVRVLIPWHLAPGEVREVLRAVTPRLLIVHADLLQRVYTTLADLPEMQVAVVDTHPELARVHGLNINRELPASANVSRWSELIGSAAGALPIPAAAPRAISLTSGTTGCPKVIRWEGPQRWETWYEHRTDRRPPIGTSLVTAPLYHGGQYGVFSQAWRMRASQVILPKFDAEAFLAAVQRYRVNHAYMVPAMFVRLLRLSPEVRARYDVSSLNYIVHSGWWCAPDVKRRMIGWFGPVIWEAYGCSETSTIAVCSSEQWLAKPGTVGRPVRRVAILNEHHAPCPAGRIGRIFVDASGMAHLHSDGEAIVRRRVGGAEMIATGDTGYLDDDGDLFVAGRADDLINTGRVKVYPAEIENVILRHPRVLDCSVFAIPDAEFGQVIGAVVEVDDPAPDFELELRSFLKGEISEHKIPVVIRTQRRALRTAAGKVDRRCRDTLSACVPL